MKRQKGHILFITLVMFLAGTPMQAKAPPVSKSVQPGVVQCANLIYGNYGKDDKGKGKTSVCFSDRFLAQIQRLTHVRTARKFTAVKLESRRLFRYPFAVMTGEGSFKLTAAQRDGLRHYLQRGGFLVASAGCGNAKWARSFEKQIKAVFPKLPLKPIAISHPIFRTVYHIKRLKSKRAEIKPQLLGMQINGKLVLVYTRDGLNDTARAGGGCCCCGGSEIINARQINVNLLAYALTH